MKNKKQIPVGATWVAESTEIKRKSYIWLSERRKSGIEIWRWKTVRTYDNESVIDEDWDNSYVKAKDDALIWNPSGKRIKYKRIK